MKFNVTVWAKNVRVWLCNYSPGSSSGRDKMVALIIGPNHGRVHITDITKLVSHLCYSDPFSDEEEVVNTGLARGLAFLAAKEQL